MTQRRVDRAALVAACSWPAVAVGRRAARRCMKLPSGPGAPARRRRRRARRRRPRACRARPHAHRGDRRQRIGRRPAAARPAARRASRAPASARLEAVAPFGAPLFIFVADRRRRDAAAAARRPRARARPPDAVLDAVAGVPLDAADLRATLTGCAARAGRLARRAARRRLARACRDGPATTCTCTATATGAVAAGGDGRIAAARRGWRAEYRDFAERAAARSIRLRRATRPARFDLQLGAVAGRDQRRRSAPTCSACRSRRRRADHARRAAPIRSARRAMTAGRCMRVRFARSRRSTSICACSACGRTAITSCGRSFSRSRCTTR